MKYDEILETIKQNKSITIVHEDGELFLSRNDKNLWRRKVWGSWGYLTDEEMAEELANDYKIILMY